MENNDADIIAGINQAYEELHHLTDDALRAKVQQIEVYIEQAADKTQALDEYLTEVFAIVKETARRFMEGNIEVTANKADRLLALDKSNDFISIQGDKAIYHNQWYTGNGTEKWAMVHFDEQLLGGYYLHKGYAVEMATGEGKTLVATLPVFLNALTHQGVHLMTVNDYLSTRDCFLTRPLYAFYGLTVGCIEQDSRTRQAYEADIVFGTTHTFTFDYLRDNIATTAGTCVQRGHYYAIIDELDSCLIDQAGTPHIISGRMSTDNSALYQHCNSIIVELLQLATKGQTKQAVTEQIDATTIRTAYYMANKYHHEATFTEEGIRWLRKRLGDKYLFRYLRLFQISFWQDLSPQEQSEWQQRLELGNALQKCLKAHTTMERNVDYIVEDAKNNEKKIVIIEQSTGRPLPSNRWSHGLHTAIEAKEGVHICSDKNSMAVVSLKNYFRLYGKISGMSGTITAVAEELATDYHLPSKRIPTHKPLIRTDEPLHVYATKHAKDDAICTEVAYLHSIGRPVLIGAPSILRAREVAQMLSDRGLEHRILDATTLREEANVIRLAGEAGAITVSTSLAGRGTDIKLSDEAREHGGLAIIATDLYESLRVEQQLCGRAGRQGDPGSSVTFVSLQDAVVSELSQADLQQLQQLTAAGSDAHEQSCICRKAQEHSDARALKLRKETNSKDDIVDPYRRQVYAERLGFVRDALAARTLFARLLANTPDPEAIHSNLNRVVHQVHRATRLMEQHVSHQLDSSLPIPCIHGNKLFTFCQPIHSTQEELSLEMTEDNIVRAVYLQYYDYHWMQLVEHIGEELLPEEITAIPFNVLNMKREIERDVADCLAHMTVIVAEENRQHTATFKQNETANNQPIKKIVSPTADALCPCGSGKSFGDCHGAYRTTKTKSFKH